MEPSLEMCQKIVKSCAVLHNMAQEWGDKMEDPVVQDEEDGGHPNDSGALPENERVSKARGVAYRESLLRLF